MLIGRGGPKKGGQQAVLKQVSVILQFSENFGQNLLTKKAINVFFSGVSGVKFSKKNSEIRSFFKEMSKILEIRK